MNVAMSGRRAAAEAMCETGADFHRRGWSLATSSNYSVVLSRDPLRLLITASGKDKGRLGEGDFLLIDGDANPAEETPHRPSAEALLHTTIVRGVGPGGPVGGPVGCVLHTHSIAATVLSQRFAGAGGLTLQGYEMLKALEGVSTHEASVRLEIFPNTQHMPDLARVLAERLRDPAAPLRRGFLMSGHGLYAWGRDLGEARRHVEGIEFLLAVALEATRAGAE